MDARLFQEAIRSATATYAIPFMSTVLLLFALLSLVRCALFNDAMRILLATCGSVSSITAIGSYIYAIFRKPELLRSEQHVERMTIANMIYDKDMDPAVRDQLGRTLLDRPGHLGRKTQKNDHRPSSSGHGGEDA